jgi:hypothetical protein
MSTEAETPTPRTDRSCWRETSIGNGEVVLAQFARQLERELAAAKAEREKATMVGLKYALDIVNFRRNSGQWTRDYLAALETIEIFIAAAMGRVERGEPIEAYAVVCSETPTLTQP